ncbi:MAG: hypothetical protein OXI51_00935, partial [Chloroflexota bacterium]|nr:hypothetical protein [Chloroflexota bacterium]
AAEHRYPYVMLATELEPTKNSYDYYDQVAEENGYEAQTQHRSYLFKVHVDETEELADQAARKYVEGPSNPFLEGNQGIVRPYLQNLPGMTSRTNLLPTVTSFTQSTARGRQVAHEQATKDGDQAPEDYSSYESQKERMSIITGTPKTVIPKIRHVLEYLRPGSIFFWDGDGAMDHDDAMRSLRLMGEEIIPATREMAKEFDLKGPFEVDTKTNEPIEQEEVVAAGGS